MFNNNNSYTDIAGIDLSKLNMDQLEKIAMMTCISMQIVESPIKYGMAVKNLEALIFGGKRKQDKRKLDEYNKLVLEAETEMEAIHQWGDLRENQEHKLMTMSQIKFFLLVGEVKDKIPIEGVGEM